MDRLLCVPPLLSLIVSILLRSQYLPEYHSPSILTMQELSETVHIYGATDGPPGLRRHCARAIDSRSATGSKGSPYRVPTQSIVSEGTVRECIIVHTRYSIQLDLVDHDHRSIWRSSQWLLVPPFRHVWKDSTRTCLYFFFYGIETAW